jgi:hypothetical protein
VPLFGRTYANNQYPKLCRHLAQHQGYVTLNGREHYLGDWHARCGKKPPEVRTRYDELIAKWLANGRQLPDERPPLSINEVLLAYIKWAEKHYVPNRKKDDQNRFMKFPTNSRQRESGVNSEH